MNMGKADRWIRFIAGLVILLVAFLWLGGAAQIVLWVIGGILVLTGAIGFCPLYFPFHFSTKKSNK